MSKAHVAKLDLWAEVYNVEDLVCEFAWIDVVTMCMVGNERNIKRANVWDEREALEEMVLVIC